jgi:hypothetical protein
MHQLRTLWVSLGRKTPNRDTDLSGSQGGVGKTATVMPFGSTHLWQKRL